MPRARVALKRQLLTTRRGSWQDCGPRQILRLRLSPRIRPGFRTHAILIRLFAREENAHLSKIREFSQKYLPDKHGTVLYMFSGPDFLYATSFFPTASTYVLAGLEPVGRVPELANLSPFVVNGELRNLESSLGSLFNFSFFITQHMKSQLREGPIYGTLPILYVFLARTGKTVHELNFVSLDEQGNVQVADQGASSTRGAAPGVKIVFSRRRSSPNRRCTILVRISPTNHSSVAAFQPS